MEWKLEAMMQEFESALSLETSLVEWKLVDAGHVLWGGQALETSLVEWKRRNQKSL